MPTRPIQNNGLVLINKNKQRVKQGLILKRGWCVCGGIVKAFSDLANDETTDLYVQHLCQFDKAIHKTSMLWSPPAIRHCSFSMLIWGKPSPFKRLIGKFYRIFHIRFQIGSDFHHSQSLSKNLRGISLTWN